MFKKIIVSSILSLLIPVLHLDLVCALSVMAHVHVLALVVTHKIRTRHAENTSRVIG